MRQNATLACIVFLFYFQDLIKNTLPAVVCCKSHCENPSKYKLSLLSFQMIIVERFGRKKKKNYCIPLTPWMKRETMEDFYGPLSL